MFIQLCQINNIEPVLMTQANRYKKRPDESIKKTTKSMSINQGISYSQIANA